MDNFKNMGRLAGLLFLFNLVPYVVANLGILDQLLYASDFPQGLASKKSTIGIAVVLEFISMTAMVFFTVLIFSFIRKYGNGFSIAYLGFRFVEFGIITIGIVKLMSLTSLGAEFNDADGTKAQYLMILAESMLQEYRWIGLIYMLVFGIHCVIFYSLLFKSSLVPKFLSTLGLIATALIFINMTSILFDLSFGGFFLFAPIGLVELVLAIWLLIFGFNDINANLQND